MASFNPNQPPLVQETLLKSRRSLEELAQVRSAVSKSKPNQKKRLIKGEDIKVKRPEQFAREYRISEGTQKKMERRRRETQKRRAVVPKASILPTVGFVVRIHEGRHASKEIRETLRKIGLYKKYDAVMMKLDATSIGK